MQAAAFTPLIISTHRLDLRALETSDLPVFLGSTLRGAFGHALKEAVCVMEHRDCAHCLVAERCLYPYLFETPPPPGLSLLSGQQQAPRPFVLAPPVIDLPAGAGGDLAASSPELAREGESSNGNLPVLPRPRALRETVTRRLLAAGDQLSFDLLLVGRAVEALPYVIHAISRLAARGLGVARARFELSSVIACDERGTTRVIFTGRSPRLVPPEGAAKSLADFVRARLAQLSPRASLRLRFLTPTRIRVEGGLQAELSFPLLVRNLLRRVSLLMATHGDAPLELDFRGLLARAARIETRAAALDWWDWERYSARQRAKMKLGGFVGEVEYAGAGLEEFLPLVAAGEWLHVGANTSFGLGRYRILP